MSIVGHKIQLITNNKQDTFFRKAVGCSRFAYNWILNRYQELLSQGQKPNINKIKKEFNKIKEEEFPWIYESPKDANQQAFNNFKIGISRFFKKTSAFPKKKKKKTNESFYLSNDQIKVIGKRVCIPKLGFVKMTEELRFQGKLMSASISYQGGHWYISFAVQMNEYKKERISDDIIAIDFGVKTLATYQDGSTTESPEPLKNNLKRLAKYQRRLSRKQKGSKNVEPSNNYKKQRTKVSKLHKKITNIRQDFTHKLTSRLCRENQTIIIEDLCVKAWNKLFGKKAIDGCVGEIRRQLMYKKEIIDNNLIIIDKWFPSSKMCSFCGNIKPKLDLNERVYNCEHCSCSINRDENAAKNLYTRGLREMYACGHLTAGLSQD